MLLRPLKLSNETLTIDSIVREITFEEYEGQRTHSPNTVVAVKELTFGCLGEQSSKVSLWFDLPDPVLLSDHQIKRFKRDRKKRQENSRYNVATKTSPFPGAKYVNDNRNVAFESHVHKPFFHMRPISNDSTTMGLVKDILMHRISVLSGTGTISSHKDSEAELENRFHRIKKDMLRWQWPVSKGREQTDANTPIPSCGSNYSPSEDTAVHQIWESYLGTMKPSNSKEARKRSSRSQLPVLSALSNGISTNCSKDQRCPHIKLNISSKDVSSNEAWKYISGDTKESVWSEIMVCYLKKNELSNKDASLPLSPPHGEKMAKN